MTDGQLRALLRASGVAALVMGTHGVLTGTRGVLRGPRETRSSEQANVDSEFRFFAAWYAVTGALALRAVSPSSRDDTTVRIVGAGWLLAAAGRLRSIRASGRPHPFFLLLLALEIVVGALLTAASRSADE